MNSSQIKVKVINRSETLELPQYQTSGSDGLDVMACFDCKLDSGEIMPVTKYSPNLIEINTLVDHQGVIDPCTPVYFDPNGDIWTRAGNISFPNPESAPEFEIKEVLAVDIDSVIVLNPGERALIPTNISTQLENARIHVTPRSGLALKNGITVLNSPGKIDSDYTGVIGVILINHGNTKFRICHGDRIAQIAFEESHRLQWEQVNELTATERGNGGFGHTGVSK